MFVEWDNEIYFVRGDALKKLLTKILSRYLLDMLQKMHDSEKIEYIEWRVGDSTMRVIMYQNGICDMVFLEIT